MRIPKLQSNQYSWFIRPFLWLLAKQQNKILKPAQILGRRPKLFTATLLLYKTINRKTSPIEPYIHALMSVRVAQLNQCEFTIEHDSKILRSLKNRLDKDKLMDWKNCSDFKPKECAVLAYTDAVTDTGQHVTDRHVDQLRCYYNDDEIVELTTIISFQNMTTKFNTAFDMCRQTR
ncbi:carboxymuconolactone decarboxylase family protein [Moritella sp. F3]|uniref:carboxymuconolactone decarboxylase family protein n=1 Tax=Moritella sp. F3 TaxID=2718882 RepID=UPI0018E153A5|nr:carboxymuconolactone decarboxylase family protein [Moritella sp. F3]GIC79011.1 alkyl hydroperoxide reductase AhpD [Moritella sp. F1]GIC83443.1 alkyl hydroperoxide reductase AhpD [Moritella sp. F3]